MGYDESKSAARARGTWNVRLVPQDASVDES